MSLYDKCPKCSSTWIGEAIPADIIEHYSVTHWRREIGINGSRLGIYDGLVAYKCPDCNAYVPRDKSKWAAKLFAKFTKLYLNAR